MQLPDWVMYKVKTQHIIALTWVTKNQVTFVGGISERRPKSETFVLLGSFVFMGLYLLGKEGEREEGGYQTRRRELPRVARRSSNIMLCYKPSTWWQTGDGGRKVDTKGLDGGRERTVGFPILIKKA